MAKRPSKQELARIAAERKAQAEHDRKIQTIIGVVVVAALVVILAVVGFFIWKANQPVAKESASEAKAAVTKVSDKPAAAGKEFGFSLSKNGENKPIDGVPTVEVYMDFMCPACGTTDRSLASTWKKLLDAGQINLEVHPNSYLDANSSDEYSTRAASAVTYVAQNDPEHLLAFITALFSEDFQPQEGSSYRSVSDEKIAAQAVKAGVSEKIAAAAIKGTYKDWITAVSKYTPLRSAVQHPSGSYKGQMTTPTILINGHFWDVSSAYDSTGDLKTAFIAAMGLKEAQVGDSSALPTIGSDKTPAFPTSE